MAAATPSEPKHVRMLADRPHLKAGGTDAFAAPTSWPQWHPGLAPFLTASLRRAFRHGGAIPWSSIVENPHPHTWDLPAPTATDAHYVTEVVGHTTPRTVDDLDWWVNDVDQKLDHFTIEVDYGTYPYEQTVTPGAIVAEYLLTPLDQPKKLARPEAPTLSADDPTGLVVSAATHLHHGPAAEAVIGAMDRMMLIRPATAGDNARTTGAQAQYFISIPAGQANGYDTTWSYAYWFGASGWDGTDWTIDRFYSIASGHIFAQNVSGWTYAAEIDPETGKVTAAHPMPEGRMVNAPIRGTFDYAGPTVAWALSYPTGIRKLSGTYANASASGTGGVKLMWRPAGPWRYVFPAESSWEYVWTNVDASAIGISPFNYVPTPYYGFMWRGYGQHEAAAAEAGTGDWKELCTFPDWNVDSDYALGDPVFSTTLPDPGDEIIVVAFHDDMELDAAVVDLYLYPEATVSPVAIPLMHGGVIQGGSL